MSDAPVVVVREAVNPLDAYGTLEQPIQQQTKPVESAQEQHVKDFNSIIFDKLESDSESEEDLGIEAEPELIVNTSVMSWPSYLMHYTCLTGSTTLKVADGMGEWLADFFGITGPKYWYIIREYERQKEEEAREKEEDALFERQRGGGTA